jgi:hypothetical protein
MDALVTVANVLNATGYFVKDKLWVRALSFVATCCLAVYLISRPAPFMNLIYWNLLFVALNAVLLVRLLSKRFRSGRAAGESAAARKGGEDRSALSRRREIPRRRARSALCLR